MNDYYACPSVCKFVNLCALNTAKNVAYTYARTVRCTDEVMCMVRYDTVRYGVVRYRYRYGTVLYCNVRHRTVRYDILTVRYGTVLKTYKS